MSEKQMSLLPQQGECVVGKFLKKEVRKIYHGGEWWFSMVDIIASLTESKDPKDYWYRLKNRMGDEESAELSTICRQLKLPSKDGKNYEADCANIEGILRIVQSVPSKNAEPFKRWLAKTGFERLQENNNPDLTIRRAVMYYELQGRDKQWIQNRIDGQFTRNELTGEWQKRGVQVGQEYATLTNIISQETFGVSASKHKEIKSLKKQSLRDNMTNIELIFQRLGEESTIEVTKRYNAQGFEQNKKAARKGGESAGEARKAYEQKMGSKVVSGDNFLENKNKTKQIELIENSEIIRSIQIQNPNIENQNFEEKLEGISFGAKKK